MVNVSDILKQRLTLWVVGALVLLVGLVLTNSDLISAWRTSDTGAGSKQDALALQGEVAALIEQVSAAKSDISVSLREVESNMNRLEAQLRSPNSAREKRELGSSLRVQELRWQALREQSEYLHHWLTGSKTMQAIRGQLAAAQKAIEENHFASALQTLDQVKREAQPLLAVRSRIEQLQKIRQVYSEAKQQLDLLAIAQRIDRLPGSGELTALEDSATKARQAGEFESATEVYQSAVQSVAKLKLEVFKVAIEQAKKVAAKAIETSDADKARQALDRVKQLTELQQQNGSAQ